MHLVREKSPTKRILLAVVLLFGLSGGASGVTHFDMYGFEAWPDLRTGWVKGNLGKAWTEGEWVPYKLVITNVQDNYPGLVGLNLKIEYHFTIDGCRVADLIRSIQVGTSDLSHDHGWPMDGGDPYPLSTREEIENAQNDVGNTPDLENEWSSPSSPDFRLLKNYSATFSANIESYIHQPRDGSMDVDETWLYVDIPDSILQEALSDQLTTNTVVIYFQLHESRTFVWTNGLQSQYASNSATAGWGGFLFDDPIFVDDERCGSGLANPGSKTHVAVFEPGKTKTVPYPIPERLPGAVDGLKWLDDGDSVYNAGVEPTLSGWIIHIFGSLEFIEFATCDTTDDTGYYYFPDLTSGDWYVCEEKDRAIPPETHYRQVYPHATATANGKGFGDDTCSTHDPNGCGCGVCNYGGWGWKVTLLTDDTVQHNLNFGNMLCGIDCESPPDTTIYCTGDWSVEALPKPTLDYNCPPVDTVFEADTISGRCPLIIDRWWTFTDAAGNTTAPCGYRVTVLDTMPPTITCPPDTVVECSDGDLGMATAWDDCDPDPDIDSSDVIISPRCPLIIERTWTATDSCNNVDSCVQMITVQDTTKPDITCPPDTVFECVMGDAARATAVDNCDPDPVIDSSDVIVNARCPLIIERTWTATDSCNNVDSCVQMITVQDTTDPWFTYCPPDDTVECEATVIFGSPTADDNCMVDRIDMVLDTTFEGPGEGETSYKRCWVAVDTCGNESDTCCQTIIEFCGNFCTFTQGGWGSGCPPNHPDRTQPGCFRDDYFGAVFPSGVTIGYEPGYSARWTNPGKVEQFLPSGGTPRPLDKDHVNWVDSSATVLAGQVLALTLNVGYSCAPIPSVPGTPSQGPCYGNHVIDCSNGGAWKFNGITVDSFLVIANKALSGDSSVLVPFGASYSDVNEAATCMNQLYANCEPYFNRFAAPGSKDGSSQAASDEPAQKTDGSAELPTEFSLSQNYPNPFNPTTEISFALPQASNVRLDIYNIVGQKVAALVNRHLEAGFHTAVWDGTRAASGIYLYRLEADNFVDTKKMILLK